MRLIDAEPLIEVCRCSAAKLAVWEKESGLDYTIYRKGYDIAMNLLYTAPTLTYVSMEEHNRVIEEYELLLENMKECVELQHVEYDADQMGYGK